MRFVVYLVAVLAAAGIVYYVSGNAEPQVADATATGVEEVVVADGASATVEGDVQLISLKIPSMHCPFACYPSVKETLESEAGVAEVVLAEQKEEGVIDNPVVLIKAGTNFDLDKAISTLAGTGFNDAAVIE